jgi:uncharacterized glyoxalase superfamily protein PhnB
MAVKPVPDGYRTVTPYLVLEDVARLIEFLKAAFDAEEIERHVVPDGRVMHAVVRIGDSMVMMGEAKEAFPARPCSLYLYVPDTDGAYRQALAAGAESIMEPMDMFYGDRNAGVSDASGMQWWIGTHIEDVGPEEMARRMAAQG